MELRPYQSDAIDRTRAALTRHRSVLLQAPTGAGKTAMAAAMCNGAANRRKRIYFACHRAELVLQTSGAFHKVGIPHGFIAPGWPKRPELDVQICSIQTLSRRLDRIPPPDLLILDECVPRGTMIATPDGPRAIESLRVGDTVYGSRNGTIVKSRVKHCFERNPMAPFVRVNDLTLTANHPVWTDRGWVPAGEVKPTDMVGEWRADGRVAVSRVQNLVQAKAPREQVLLEGVSWDEQACRQDHDLRAMREGVREETIGGALLQPDVLGRGEEGQSNDDLREVRRDVSASGVESRKVLFAGLQDGACGGVDDRRNQGQCLEADHGDESDPSCEGACKSAHEERRGQADPEEGSRSRSTEWVSESSVVGRWPDETADAVARTARLADGVVRQDGHEGERSPGALLPGSGGTEPDDRYRVRRLVSHVPEGQGLRPEAGCAASGSRMGGSPLLEQGDPRVDGRGDVDDTVFNIETETGDYFANGLLVHNCHHAAARSWANVLEAWPDAYKVGLSATPERLDGKGLGDWFHELVPGPSVAWLIENGYLSDYRLFAPPGPDLTAVRTRYGDFQKQDLATAVNTRQLVGDIVEHWKQRANGMRTIAFCVSVEHSERVAEAFRLSGVRAAHIDGKTPAAERAAKLRALAVGGLQVVTNVELFGEGFDLSANAGLDCTVEAVVLARPTKSLSIYLQQVGRALRQKDEPAIILDHAGNSLRPEFGLPDDEREWKLTAGKPKKSAKAAPVRQCPKCYAVHGIVQPTCSVCGYVYPVTPREVDEVDGALEEVDKVAFRRKRTAENRAARTREQLVELGRTRGYSNPEGWAWNVMRSREEREKKRGAA